MKRLIIIVFLLCNLQFYAQQKTKIDETIIGRWIEYTETDSDHQEPTYQPYTYVFRKDKTFHLGEAHEGIILFSVGGKYSISSNTISVVYFDFTYTEAKNRKAHYISFEVLHLENTKMTLLAKDNGYEYKIYLKKTSK